MSKAERTLFIKRRKEIYEQLHPETKQGENRSAPSGQFVRTDAPAFTTDTADRTGIDERTIRRDAARDEGIPEDVLESIVGTSSTSASR